MRSWKSLSTRRLQNRSPRAIPLRARQRLHALPQKTNQLRPERQATADHPAALGVPPLRHHGDPAPFIDGIESIVVTRGQVHPAGHDNPSDVAFRHTSSTPYILHTLQRVTTSAACIPIA
jgi:hypothetical protein